MNQKLQGLFGYLLLGGIVYVIIEFVAWFTAVAKDIDPSVGVAIIGAMATIIPSVYIASYNSRKAKERVAFEAHRKMKAEIYEGFMRLLGEMVKTKKQSASSDSIVANPELLEKFIVEITTKVAVYGGPEVVNTFAK